MITKSSINGKELVDNLIDAGFSSFTGVPCSYYASVIEAALGSPDADYITAANEGSALAIAAGKFLVGSLPVIMIQNSGFGNLLNPLTSLSLIYEIGGLMLISLRGYPDPKFDEPQHSIMGSALMPFLNELGIKWLHLGELPSLQEAAQQSAKDSRNGRMTAWLVQKGTITPGARTNGVGTGLKSPRCDHYYSPTL